MERKQKAGQPGDRAVAPNGLSLVQSFVNSVNVEFGPDKFATVEGLTRWLDRHGLGAGLATPGERDLRDAVALREAFRALLRETNGTPPDPRAREALAHIARDCPLIVGFDGAEGQLGLHPAQSDMRGVFARLLTLSVQAVADGSWQRLKACHEHECEWVFYDRSRNRGGRWCSMTVCGTRAKMRTYRSSGRAAI